MATNVQTLARKMVADRAAVIRDARLTLIAFATARVETLPRSVKLPPLKTGDSGYKGAE